MASRRGSPQLRMWVALEGPGALSGRFCSHQGRGGGGRQRDLQRSLRLAACTLPCHPPELQASQFQFSCLLPGIPPSPSD